MPTITSDCSITFSPYSESDEIVYTTMAMKRDIDPFPYKHTSNGLCHRKCDTIEELYKEYDSIIRQILHPSNCLFDDDWITNPRYSEMQDALYRILLLGEDHDSHSLGDKQKESIISNAILISGDESLIQLCCRLLVWSFLREESIVDQNDSSCFDGSSSRDSDFWDSSDSLNDPIGNISPQDQQNSNPLHLACKILPLKTLVSTLEDILSIDPDAARNRDASGKLPLETFHFHFRHQIGSAIFEVLPLIEAFPEALLKVCCDYRVYTRLPSILKQVSPTCRYQLLSSGILG